MPRSPDVDVDVDVVTGGTRWSAQLAARLQRGCRIVLAEGDDPRVRAAAGRLAAYGTRPLLVLGPSRPHGEDGPPLGDSVRTATVAELAAGAAGARVADEGRQRGWSQEQVERRRTDPLYLAAALVAGGAADSAVAGSTRPSGDVIRAGLHMIGLTSASALLSSSFLLRMPTGRTFAFGDCAVVPDPDSAQLADIAVATAATFTAMTGEDAQVAMLSFSTLGSAEHESVRRVREATELVRRRAPGLRVDGELQFDAAIAPAVAEQKAAGSPVAGQANVFIFPNLSAGNIGYKIAERLGGAEALGPIIQGLRAPMNDLSRGCSASDVVSVALVGALQTQPAARQRPSLDPA